jgi:hypothetical protein
MISSFGWHHRTFEGLLPDPWPSNAKLVGGSHRASDEPAPSGGLDRRSPEGHTPATCDAEFAGSLAGARSPQRPGQCDSWPSALRINRFRLPNRCGCPAESTPGLLVCAANAALSQPAKSPMSAGISAGDGNSKRPVSVRIYRAADANIRQARYLDHRRAPSLILIKTVIDPSVRRWSQAEFLLAWSFQRDDSATVTAPPTGMLMEQHQRNP